MKAFVLAIAILMLGTAARAETALDKKTYYVTGVSPEDALNVREAPGPAGTIVGALPPGAHGISVTGREEPVERSLWREIRWRGLSGWVNARYLAMEPEGVPNTAICGGTEPFWDFRLLKTHGYFHLMGRDGREISIDRIARPIGRPGLYVFEGRTRDEAEPVTWMVEKEPESCSTDMTLERFPYSVAISFRGGPVYAGCCRYAQPGHFAD